MGVRIAVGGSIRSDPGSPGHRTTLAVWPIPQLQRIESRRADEENLSAEPNQTVTDTRFPRAHEDSFGTGDSQKTTRQGAKAPGRPRCLEVIVGQRTGRFGRSDRLLKSRDYVRLSRKGSRAASPEFVVLMSLQPEDKSLASQHSPRLGLSASRKVGGAVVRNYIKRSVREWFRNRRKQLPEGTDLVVIARRGAAGLPAQRLAKCLDDLVARNPLMTAGKGHTGC